MKMFVKAFAVISILGLLAWNAVGGRADEEKGNGLISGILINGTTEEKVSDQEVILKRYEGDQEKEEQKTVSDAQGRFYFRGVDSVETRNYFVHTLYKGVEYYSPQVAFKNGAREIPVEMTLYEPTDSDKDVAIAMHHVLLEPVEGTLWVRELMIVENKGNRVYVGSEEIAPEKKETLRISLPPQAQDLEMIKGLMSCCIVQMQGGFSDTMDIKPGKKEIHFRYKILYKGSRLVIAKTIHRITGSLDFFIPKQGVRASAENLQYAGLMGEPGKEFLHFTGKGLANGTQVALNMESLPGKRISFKLLAPIIGVLLFAFGLVLPLVRRRRGAVGDEMEKARPRDERQHLLMAIAQLDDKFESGQISEEEHEKRRRALKEKALGLTKIPKSNEL